MTTPLISPVKTFAEKDILKIVLLELCNIFGETRITPGQMILSRKDLHFEIRAILLSSDLSSLNCEDHFVHLKFLYQSNIV
ncbi:CLUMA_CG016326, isoform A [Clunio marinus]|uniref:CLUMA_CG016326, isoform A n=1 Tax=Clunio marinus TaxID=568069 RepID=A0A1J1IVR2_9DIPT|nr:CLUMA_CG016326, isoform A [Clunio marinus]